MRSTLIVDLGSTSIKAAAIDDAGVVTDIGERASPPSVAPAGRHESDPLAFVEAVRSLLADALQVAPYLQAVAFSTQMHGILLTDGDDAISPFLSWQDERAAEPTASGQSTLEIVAGAVPGGVIQALGAPLRVGLGGFTLARWLEEHPETQPGRIHTLGSFVVSQLGGRYATHITNAAPLGLVDLRRRKWNQEVVRALGLSRFELPEIVTGFHPIGKVSVGGVELELYPDLGDHQASLLGSRLSEGDVAISLGTAGIAARLANMDTAAGPGVEVRPYGEGTVLHVRSRLPGGRLLRTFAHARSASEAQFWSEVSATSEAGLADDIRAFFAGFTDAYSEAISDLFPDGERPRRILLNGGAAQHIPWFQSSFPASLGVNHVEVPDSDLAIRGVVSLLQAASSAPDQRSPHAH